MPIFTVTEQTKDNLNPWYVAYSSLDLALSGCNHELADSLGEEAPFHCHADSNNPRWLMDEGFLEREADNYWHYRPMGRDGLVCYTITEIDVVI